MSSSQSNYVVRNSLMFAYRALRVLGRFVEGSHLSPYKDFYEKVLNRKLDGEVPNSEVEAFYLNRLSEGDFLANADGRVSGIGDSDLMERLLSVVWELQCAMPTNASICTGANKQCGRLLWEMFLRLDTQSQMEVHIDDVCDLTLRIFKANGHIEQAENIREWFCGQQNVDFWSFFRTMVENYGQLLQSPIVTELYSMITTEMIREGKLTKKGHLVPNWKGRWFTLTTSALTYHEAKDGPPLKSIVVNGNTQVQNMPESKGHQYRFRVLDGSSSTPTEMSASDEFTMREWMAFIKLAIKMNQVDGRNFLHKYRVAIDSFPKSFFGQASAVPSFTATSRLPPGRKAHTSPGHRSLGSSQSVPLDKLIAKERGKPDKKPLPPVPSEQDNDDTQTDLTDSSNLNDPPPIPPQRFDPMDTQDLNQGVQSNSKKQFTAGTTQGVPSSSGGHSKIRRHSSFELSDIHHIQVDGDLEYAVITKSPKKKAGRGKKSSAPEQTGRNCISPDPSMKAALDAPPLPPPHRRSPILSHKSASVEDKTHAIDTPPLPPPHRRSPILSTKSASVESPHVLSTHTSSSNVHSRTPTASPTSTRKGYIELQFEAGNVVAPKPQTQVEQDMPHDVKNKFGYTQLNFEGSKEKEKENGEMKKTAKKAPPPVPKYQGNMMKSTTETVLSGTNHSATSGSKEMPRTKPSSLPNLKKNTPKARELDYAQVSFSNNPAISPSITHRMLPTPEEASSPESRHKAPRVEYASVILTQARIEIKEDVGDKEEGDQKKRSNYENFDLGPENSHKEESSDKKKRSNYENFDLGPTNSRPNETKGRDQCATSTNGPVVAGSARLLKNSDIYGRKVDDDSPYVNVRHPCSADQSKPRAAPRKMVTSPNQDSPPMPPARKTS